MPQVLARRAVRRLANSSTVGLIGVVAGAAMMILHLAMIAAQLLFQMLRRLIGAEIGIGRHRIGFSHAARVEVHHAFGMKPEAVLADRGVTGKSTAVEILCDTILDAGADAFAKR